MIHPSAIVHPGARLGENVSIGAYSVIGEHVEIGSDTRVGPHVVVEGHTRIGRDNRVFQFSSLGAVPQDKKYAGEPTRLEIGDGNTIREFCSLNCGTAQDAGVTRVGNDNWIMAYVHVRTTARSAAMPYSPITLSLPATCMWAITPSSAVSPVCISSCTSVRTVSPQSPRCWYTTCRLT